MNGTQLSSFRHSLWTSSCLQGSLHALTLITVISIAMRVITWNVNGIKTLPQYHPWTQYKSLNDILNSEHLACDVLCMQEMKTPRTSITRDVALPDSFDAFLSFPTAATQDVSASQQQSQKKAKTGYSGSGIYTRRGGTGTRCAPLLAESLLCFPPKDTQERISPSDHAYPALMDFVPQLPIPSSSDDSDKEEDEGEDQVQADSSCEALDSEGRSIILDFGLFVLINVYCPNSASGRDTYKRAYHAALEARVNALLQEGREVMVVGDLNATPFPIDHCEGEIDTKRRGIDKWYDGPHGTAVRAWLRNWLVPLPLKDDEVTPPNKLVDVVRMFHPERKAMYTCWNTLLSARESNYGTRIDFILVSKGLLPWIKDANIMPDLRGSDHCPVYVDLRDDLTTSDGETVSLKTVLGKQGESPEPPKLATKFWDEYSGKQTRLDKFFGGKSQTAKKDSSKVDIGEPPMKKRKVEVEDSAMPEDQPSGSSAALLRPSPPISTPSLSPPPNQPAPTISTQSKIAGSNSSKGARSSKKTTASRHTSKSGSQSNISSFFQRPSSTKAKSETIESSSLPSTSFSSSSNIDDTQTSEELDEDFLLAMQLSQSPPSPSLAATPSTSKDAWSQLLKLPEAPRCTVHGEPGKRFIVNKKGPNKGRAFYVCSRPVGPGYDAGKERRAREDVDIQWRCNFFKWEKEIK
ncbi:DNase I-like protein [Flagelloscypha sp. PMI_526]|nr:DNase I-like protein [Flagelloscypha sp. PMI_526]